MTWQYRIVAFKYPLQLLLSDNDDDTFRLDFVCRYSVQGVFNSIHVLSVTHSPKDCSGGLTHVGAEIETCCPLSRYNKSHQQKQCQ
jgi:hypothetical protein